MRALGWLAMLPLAGCAAEGMADRPANGPAAAERLAVELEGYARGETEECLPVTMDTATPRVVDERTIVYSRSRSIKWITTLPAACPGLRPTSTLVVRRFGARTCRLDNLSAFDAGPTAIPGPRCTFGAFTRYDLK